MDATSLALSWLLLAQTGGGAAPNPFNFRDAEATPRRTAPAAAIPEEQPPERERGFPAARIGSERSGSERAGSERAAPDKTAPPWNDRNTDNSLKELDEKALGHNRTLQKELPQPNGHSPLFRDSPAANANEAPAWGGGSAAHSRTTETSRTDALRSADAQRTTEPRTNAFGTPRDEDRPAENARPAAWGQDAAARPIGNPREERFEGIIGALLVPLRSRSGQFSASEVLSQAMTPAAGVKLPGRAVTLLEVVSRAGDRAQQLRATKAYWRLAIAEAQYNWRLDTRRWAGQLTPQHNKPNDSNVIKTLQASASARLNEAELMVLAAQYEIADLIERADLEDLPLAADEPFVGNYRTYFRELFAERDPPGRTRVIDRSLPIRREQIAARTKAVFSADEAMHVVIDEYNHGQADVHDLWGCLEDLHRERLMFLNAVRDYNYDIAEYATTVADGGTTSAALVSMMIRTSHATASSGGRAGGENTGRGSSTFLQRQPTRVRPIEYQQEEDGSSAHGNEKHSAQNHPSEKHSEETSADNRPAEFVEQRKPVSVMVPAEHEGAVTPATGAAHEHDRVQRAEFREAIPHTEPQVMPPLVPLQALRELPKKPVSVMVRPVRE